MRRLKGAAGSMPGGALANALETPRRTQSAAPR
jgi:hypothetical protein